MRSLLNALFLMLISAQFALGQIKVVEAPAANKPIRCMQWEVTDLVYTIKQKFAQPHQQEAFAVLTDEEGVQRIPLFYNGDNQWVFRYSGSTVGTKSFSIQSEIKELNGKKGTIEVLANEKSDRHGGVVLNEDDPRHFYYEDGTSYFNLAFECDWLFALDYGRQGLSKTSYLLDLIAENGFNQVVMNVYAYDVDTNWVADELLQQHPEHNYGAREDIFPFMGTNSNPDYSTLNLEFFKHFDRVISAMHDREIVSHLMIYVWNKLVNWPEPGSDADNMYYDYVIKRYQAFPNLIWDVSKEAASKIAIGKFTNIVQHLEGRIGRTRQLDAYNRMVSVHDYGFCSKHRDIVDFISTQNWKLSLYDHMLDVYKEFPDKPVFNIEHGGYEKSPYNVFPGGYDDAEVCLRRNYLCLFAGTYTTYYWQAAAWTAVIHNPFEQPAGFIKPRFDYFKHMRAFFDQFSFENFEPVTKYNTRSYNLTDYKNGVVLLFLPKEVYNDDVKNQLEEEFDFTQATVQWFNTLTGEYTPEEKLEFKHFYTIWDWRPWRNEADAIMVIRQLKTTKN